MRLPLVLRLLAVIALGLAVVLVPSGALAQAATTLTVDSITWNVVGLDSNDVNAGPATYPVGARICNRGTEPSSVGATFRWTTSSTALALEGPSAIDLGVIAAGACRDAYWNVTVNRSVASYGATRGYVIEASASDGAVAATPSPRELFVERLISQNRNSVNSITGPTAVTVGDEVTYVVDADTAPAGFEQLEAFLTFPSSIFQVVRVAVTYEKPVGATNDTMYADACGWDTVPTSPTYLSCVGPARYDGGKVGGGLLSTFTVRVIGTGTAELTSAIYDKSGSSYHYNTDFSVRPNLLIVTASAPPPPTTTTVPTTGLPPAATTPPVATSVTGPQPAAGVTTTTAGASSGRPNGRSVSAAVATTGPSDTGRLTLVGVLLLTAGLLSMGAARVGERSIAPSPFERSLHDLRRTLHAHEEAGPGAWELMAALDRVGRALPPR